MLLANESVSVQKYHVWMTAIIYQHTGNITSNYQLLWKV